MTGGGRTLAGGGRALAAGGGRARQLAEGGPWWPAGVEPGDQRREGPNGRQGGPAACGGRVKGSETSDVS